MKEYHVFPMEKTFFENPDITTTFSFFSDAPSLYPPIPCHLELLHVKVFPEGLQMSCIDKIYFKDYDSYIKEKYPTVKILVYILSISACCRFEICYLRIKSDNKYTLTDVSTAIPLYRYGLSREGCQ